MGEGLTLVLVVLALLLFVLIASKARSYRSLQFQMLPFAIVLFVAELPRILGTLGLVDLTNIEDIGLELHSISMVFLSAFLAYRIYGFFKSK